MHAKPSCSKGSHCPVILTAQCRLVSCPEDWRSGRQHIAEVQQAFSGTISLFPKFNSGFGVHSECVSLCLQDRGVDPVAVDAATPPPPAVAPVALAYSALAAPSAQAAPRQACSCSCSWPTSA